MTHSKISSTESATQSYESHSTSIDGRVLNKSRICSVSNIVQPRHFWYLSVKVFVDFLLALVLLVILLPVIFLAGLFVKLTSKGPVFYFQNRLGKNGRKFQIVKIRTMVHNAEGATGAVWATADDSRITWIGKILRETHVDEFPQLLNVLLCQMSLIGPRPERPEFADELEWKLPHYQNRLLVRPGITGIAQLNLLPDTDLESVRKKLIHDLYYVRNVNPWLDFRILVFTLWDFSKTIFCLVGKFFVLPEVDCVTSGIAEIEGVESALLVEVRD